MRRRLIVLVAVFATAFAATPAGAIPDRAADRALPDAVSELRLNTPVTAQLSAAQIDALLGTEAGPARVLIRLKDPSVAETGLRGRAAAQARRTVADSQNDLLQRVMTHDPTARVLGSVQLVLNAVFVEVDRAAIGDILAEPDVFRVVPVADYELDLSETVPYIGASAVQNSGFDGAGVSVAVLDSGIDYTHAALGGSGEVADYNLATADPAVVVPSLFPNAKVVGGYDFVGSAWTSGLTPVPDPDPIDDGPEAGHGTHVAHIIAGEGGVAPAADLYALKVCSSISTSCSGIGLLQAIEFAVDPNGDGDPSDAVDIINMSLGAPYGQPFDDDLSLAVDNASALGVLTVASAGNSGDKPYVTGTPSAAPSALSVAQTQVPSAGLQLITIAGQDIPAIFQPWSAELTELIEGPLQYGDGAGGNLLGCNPFAAGSLDGKVVLVNRGDCNFTLKVKNIGDAGGVVGIIGLVAPGDPFSGGDGGDRPIDIPGYMVSLAAANFMRANLGATATLDPANQLPLIGQMVGSSSRGPSNQFNQLKPEIGAPGASVSAIAGTGTDMGPFGGTSGAAPMVAGSAALVLQAMPHLSPAEVKSLLMNTGDTAIDTDPFAGLAPVSRIGGGEVRVDSALAARAAAWDVATSSGALSFGYVEVAKDTVQLQRQVRVRNYSNSAVVYNISPSFRFAGDDTGAVSISAPNSVRVQAGKDAVFTVRMTIKGALLPGNFMNSGSQGANPLALNANEFDGYLTLDDGSQPIHLAWHVLPRKSSDLNGRQGLNLGGGQDAVSLRNNGVGIAQNDAYSLLAVSEQLVRGDRGGQTPTPDIRAVGVNTFPVPAGFCSGTASFVWAFAVNTWEPQSHLLPVSHQVWLDIDQDGEPDYVLLNRDASGLGGLSDGRQLAWVLNLGTGSLSAFFFAEHASNTGNTVLLICGEQVGLTGTDMLNTNVDAFVVAQDFYFGGPGDVVDGLTITPLGERYFGIPEDIAGKSNGSMTVVDFGLFPGNSEELGVMLITNGDRGAGNRGGATHATEAMLFLVK
jgi:minor extracellular serine protease Vpr